MTISTSPRPPAFAPRRKANGSGEYWTNFAGDRRSDRLTRGAAAFIAERDSLTWRHFGSGWAYVQHRGSPPGFIRILDDKTLAIPDFRGNRQYISTGNLATNDRAALILMDYPHRRRLDLRPYRGEDLTADPELAAKLLAPDYRAKMERGLIIHLVAFNWDLPRGISCRDSARPSLRAALAPVERLEALEEGNQALRASLLEEEVPADPHRPHPEGGAKHGVWKR